MSTALATRTSQMPLVELPVKADSRPRTSGMVMLALDVPPESKIARDSQIALLMPRSAGDTNVTVRSSQLTVQFLYKTSNPSVKRNRAWFFTLDGHAFYVLDLGPEGTFLYDQVTNQWCRFITDGFDGWNFVNGSMWGKRIVGADSISTTIWEMIPTAVLDEGWRDITHVVTGGLTTRSRTTIAVDAVRVSGSVGQLDEVNGATFTLRYSDDQGKTWSDNFDISLIEDDFDGEMAWRSLGSFMAPGRIFEFSDVGGLLRIDGADAFLNGFDNDQQDQGG